MHTFKNRLCHKFDAPILPLLLVGGTLHATAAAEAAAAPGGFVYVCLCEFAQMCLCVSCAHRKNARNIFRRVLPEHYAKPPTPQMNSQQVYWYIHYTLDILAFGKHI